MKVYLCGGINGLTDDQAVTWRERAKDLLHCETLDPMRRDFRGREDECVNDIVLGDKADIKLSNALLVNAERPSWGTAMEIVYAFTAGKTIVAICPSDTISPWLRFHATRIYKSLEEACEWLNTESFARSTGGYAHGGVF